MNTIWRLDISDFVFLSVLLCAGAVEIQNVSSFFVHLKTSFGLKILFAKDGERIYVQVDVSWKRRTSGLCGTYNGNLRDDFL